MRLGPCAAVLSANSSSFSSLLNEVGLSLPEEPVRASPTMASCQGLWPSLGPCQGVWPSLGPCQGLWPSLGPCPNYLSASRPTTRIKSQQNPVCSVNCE